MSIVREASGLPTLPVLVQTSLAPWPILWVATAIVIAAIVAVAAVVKRDRVLLAATAVGFAIVLLPSNAWHHWLSFARRPCCYGDGTAWGRRALLLFVVVSFLPIGVLSSAVALVTLVAMLVVSARNLCDAWPPTAEARRYTRPAMTHVFVAPHPDDAALSCGGLIANLRELGQNVAILTALLGHRRRSDDLTTYQREALGFGSKAVWPVTEAFNRAHLEADYPVDDPAATPPWQATKGSLDATQSEADAAAKRFWQRSSWYRRASIHNESLAGQPIIDDVSAQGAVLTTERTEAADAGDIMATRRLEDERYAAFAEVSMIWLDLPDAVFRGYEGDDQLLGAPRDDDPAPVDALRRELARLEPQRVYLPLGIGGHVDHQLTRNAGIALLHDARRWVMPGVDWTGQLVFYEDFPYAWWEEFRRLEELPDGSLAGLPAGVSLTAEFADIGDQLERKIMGIDLYQSQIERLFTNRRAMADAVRGFGAKVADLGRVPGGAAERYWVTTRS